ncbi:unnamed protein product [Coffea canephora]|uniref:Uncharacterized protein n=1 Tax=Coffea canephora TaxID=49390 RepID=A0A068VFE6_COFCA|nr:unnamed protein product [Coffea canephora]
MSQENKRSNFEEPAMRITRARAKALGQSGGLPPLYPSSKPNDNRVLRPNFKRTAPDENKPVTTAAACHQHKKRAVLNDVTNIICKNSYRRCISSPKLQEKKHSIKRNAKVVPAARGEKPENKEEKIENLTCEMKIKAEEKINLSENIRVCMGIKSNEAIGIRGCLVANLAPIKQNHSKHVELQNQPKREKIEPCLKHEGSDDQGITDIDAKHKDPLMCSLYAPDIYRIMTAMELGRRPSVDYMEKLQRDITQGMRGILIDWLVEVSEEYRLVPDTLYLTVNLIDRFLSGNYIEKQKLQLLGVTCMLIASKYEEICAPRVEEFCFITDNTYGKDEVVKMESRVLNFLGFQLSLPTTKKFLRRFIQAAQASYEVPSVELEFLANYLAELTLLEYSFVKFLPSLTAASALFLARWTLDQSDHPWNPTLEHYTSYKVQELKTTVLALQDLQLNKSGCPLNAIREKYRQTKFKSVATLSSLKPVQPLFEQHLGI